MAGRKDRYKMLVEPHLEEIEKKVREGVTEYQIAQALGIAVSTLANYKLKHPELAKALEPKGAGVLDQLVNAGIQSAIGYFKENEVTTIVIDDSGTASKKQKTITKTWYPPNATLNRFYVLNYGKGKFFDNPTDYELKKAEQELREAMLKEKNWQAFIDGDEEKK